MGVLEYGLLVALAIAVSIQVVGIILVVAMLSFGNPQRHRDELHHCGGRRLGGGLADGRDDNGSRGGRHGRLPVWQRYEQLLSALDDVVVGENVPLAVIDDAGSDAGRHHEGLIELARLDFLLVRDLDHRWLYLLADGADSRQKIVTRRAVAAAACANDGTGDAEATAGLATTDATGLSALPPAGRAVVDGVGLTFTVAEAEALAGAAAGVDAMVADAAVAPDGWVVDVHAAAIGRSTAAHNSAARRNGR